MTKRLEEAETRTFRGGRWRSMTEGWNGVRFERDRFRGDPKCIGCTLVMSARGLRCEHTSGKFKFA